MKNLLLASLISLSVFSPAFAQSAGSGVPKAFQSDMAPGEAPPPLLDSTAATGDGPHNSGPTSDNQYLKNQMPAPGNVPAPLVSTPRGNFSTFVGTSGQKINGPNLPLCRTGILAPSEPGVGGNSLLNSNGEQPKSKVYPQLPPTYLAPVE